jgi:hypothetical protein
VETRGPKAATKKFNHVELAERGAATLSQFDMIKHNRYDPLAGKYGREKSKSVKVRAG